MDKREFSVFCMALKTYFPRDNILPNTEAMALWYDSLQDIGYSAAETFLKKWVSTEKWPPSIAEIRKGCKELSEFETPDWGTGWCEVLKAIGRYGFMQRDRALESMTPITRACVERLGWQNLCNSENETADRANFRQLYEQLKEREFEQRVLPTALMEKIAQFRIGQAPDAKALTDGK